MPVARIPEHLHGPVEREIVAQYQHAWRATKQDLDLLHGRIKQARANGVEISRDWVRREARLEDLQQQIEARIRVITGNAQQAISQGKVRAATQAIENSRQLIRNQIGDPPPGISFHVKAPTSAFEQLVQTSTGNTHLGNLLGTLAPTAGSEIRQKLATGILQGRNPNAVARDIRTVLGGNINRARTIARTEILRAYRETTRDTFAANADVVTGWVWEAELDDTTCEICWAMHGQVFDTEQDLDTHPNCRCAMVPQTKTWEQFGFPDAGGSTNVSIIPGEDLFARLDETVQRRILGPGKLSLYKQGRIGLRDVVVHTRKPAGRRVRSLRDLVARERKTA